MTPWFDFELLKRALHNPAAAELLILRSDNEGNTWVDFKTTRQAFIAKGLPDPPDYVARLREQRIPLWDRRLLEEKIADLISIRPVTVDFGTGEFVRLRGIFNSTYKQYAGSHGGAFTAEPHETTTGNVEVLINERMIESGNSALDVAIRNYGIRFDVDVVVIHELGHALAYVRGNHPFFSVWSVEMENQLRARRGERRFRVNEFPVIPDPKTHVPDLRRWEQRHRER